LTASAQRPFSAVPPDQKNTFNLRCAFIVSVLCLAVFQFSENTADPDLWSHLFFGTELIETGKPPTIDYYSWTAYGQPSVDHEYLGEAVFGLVYLGFGGAGVLWFKMLVGMLTFGLALSTGPRNLDPKTKLIAWAFGAVAVVEISFGFAARPQIFTALLLAVELWLLTRIHAGKWPWALALPPLFALWFNLHGGSLAGLILLFAAAGATTAQTVIRIRAIKTFFHWDSPTSFRSAVLLWLAAIVSAATVVLNPHGLELARWLVGSILWLRPQIQEWNPATLDGDHATFFICAALAAAAYLFSRKPRQLWEMAVLGILFLVAFRAVRNTPLFCVAALALVPPHLADVLQRFRSHFKRFEELFQSTSVQKVSTMILALVSAGIIACTCTLHKKHFWTMEIPRAQYPVAATQFIQQHELHGNLLVFFDWGEMCIWNLTNSPVSIDGRLDSVYSPELIAAHWKFYNAEPFDTNVLNIARADFALLPCKLAGAKELQAVYGWQPVYFDNLAVVLVKNPKQFPGLAGLALPIEGDTSATEGRDTFPNHVPPRR
jgi:hypothetical protein